MPRLETLFALSCISAFAVAQTAQDICNARSNTNVTEEDCLAMPKFSQAFENNTDDLTWKRYEVDSEGYLITMVRVTGDSNNDASTAAPRGPILLVSGLYKDGLTYLERSDESLDGVVQRLFDAGFDVWISNRRGTQYSQGHTTANLINDDPATYWNWDI